MNADALEPAGITPTERVLFKLCRSSFLQLWSYSNVFRNQGKKSDGDGKELCDVLVIFGDSVILFSDKSCVFPSTGDLPLDWSRWHARAVEASKKQLRGAERWVRSFPEQIYLDRRCTERIPIDIPPPGKLRVFKVAVAIGAAARNREHFGSGSGSLALMIASSDTQIVTRSGARIPIPFTSHLQEFDGDIFHVVDDVTLDVILRELDTISDFVAYLETKERLILTGKLGAVMGEEDLVGLFLGVGAGLLSLPDNMESGDRFAIAEGIYQEILSKKEYQCYLESNNGSYFWDYLISHHTVCVLDGTLVEGSVRTIKENEQILRLLAQESRVSRRLLAEAYLNLMESAPREEITSRTYSKTGDTVYIFQVNPRMSRDYADYRRQRQAYLSEYCVLTGWRFQDKKRIIGIVTDGAHPMKDGYDVIVLEFSGWTPDMISHGAELNRIMAESVSRPLTRWRQDLRFLTPWTGDDRNPHKPKSGKRSKNKKRRGNRK